MTEGLESELMMTSFGQLYKYMVNKEMEGCLAVNVLLPMLKFGRSLCNIHVWEQPIDALDGVMTVLNPELNLETSQQQTTGGADTNSTRLMKSLL